MEWTVGIISAAGSVVLTLTVTYLFNYFVGLPKRFRTERNKEKEEIMKLKEENNCLTIRIEALEESVSHYPEYREQSRRIQQELQNTDINILEVCNLIKQDVVSNREMLDTRLKSLENRERNSLRAKILEEYRLYTDDSRNPLHAWSEMEAHSFFKLVEDYESLGGNDYVHSTVLPEMHHLRIINMQDLIGLKELYQSRRIK